MGCVQSQRDSGDIHPNVFRVINVDDDLNELWSGQLEVTDSEVILYREGTDAVIWPLRCLRRFGHDRDIVSFESGRRCATGEGIFAFRCRRATMLFEAIQENIAMRNIMTDAIRSRPPSFPNSSPGTLPRLTFTSTVRRRSSFELNQQLGDLPVFRTNFNSVTPFDRRPPALEQAPLSPSSVDVLEVTSLNSNSSSQGQATNIYQLQEMRPRESNNNLDTNTSINNNQNSCAVPNTVTNTSSLVPAHTYCNDFNKDLAALRETFKNIKPPSEENETPGNVMASNITKVTNTHPPLSPSLSTSSEHYARLSIENQSPSYMNISAIELSELKQAKDAWLAKEIRTIRNELNANTSSEANLDANLNKKDIIVNGLNDKDTIKELNVQDSNKNRISTTASNLNYVNINSRPDELNSYMNLAVGEVIEQLDIGKPLSFNGLSELSQKVPEPDSGSVEELINYAVLDIDSNKPPRLASPETHSIASSKHEFSTPRAAMKLMAQQSLDSTSEGTDIGTASLGYTVIDFNKTTVLTDIQTKIEKQEDIDENFEGTRKTRHNSTITITSENGDGTRKTRHDSTITITYSPPKMTTSKTD